MNFACIPLLYPTEKTDVMCCIFIYFLICEQCLAFFSSLFPKVRAYGGIQRRRSDDTLRRKCLGYNGIQFTPFFQFSKEEMFNCFLDSWRLYMVRFGQVILPI